MSMMHCRAIVNVGRPLSIGLSEETPVPQLKSVARRPASLPQTPSSTHLHPTRIHPKPNQSHMSSFHSYTTIDAASSCGEDRQQAAVAFEAVSTGTDLSLGYERSLTFHSHTTSIGFSQRRPTRWSTPWSG
jgi:hypothetical protein